jgi:antitoxin component HigA of HigAB toxin-antitoxin module
MSPDLHEASRVLTTSGFSADIYFNPSKITQQLKKSVIQQITNCAITGGYKSQASRIAKHLMDEFEIPYSNHYGNWLHVQFLSEDSQNKAVELVQADLAAYLLEGNEDSSYERKRTSDAIELIRKGETAYVGCYNKVFCGQLKQLMSKSMPPEVKEKAAALVARLDDPTPIKLTLKDWN